MGTMEKRDEEATEEGSLIIWEALKSIICNNIDYYKHDESTNGLKLHGSLIGIIDQIDQIRQLYKEIQSFCKDYDLDETTKANGYRSFLKVFDCAINHTLKILNYIMKNRSSLLFRKSAYTKEVEACNHLLAAFVTFFNHLLTFHASSEPGNLFPVKEHSADEILERASTINQFAFYGRCQGFQVYDSVKPVLKFISISMASYSESYYSNNGKFIKATNSMFTSGKYFFDPELRARRIVNLSNNARIDFCKNFWFLAEAEIMHSIPFVNYRIKVNRLLKINPEPLKVLKNNGEHVEVIAPGIIQARLLSSHAREGMLGDRERRKKEDCLPKSNSLIIHAHGGGFVSQSSKSHLVYLLEWATFLNVPILSLDYSLAPEHPYPKALNEMFYLYCWALEHQDMLGTTCEKVIFAGDSAGANLSLATLLKCIDMKIRKPDGVFIAYCPILVGFDPSPSRLLCMIDPLIPFGFLMRCLKAYSCGNKDTSVSENSEQNETENDLAQMKRAKADRNEELKRKSSLNNELELQELHNLSEEDKSDSFEEISCFERHQTDSDIKAHISQNSEDDTLAGTFPTATDYKSSNELNDTIEIVSPIDSIRSATSLELDEEDSLPITIQKNEKICSENVAENVHLQPTTSDDKKYVDDFIEKYICDARQCDDGSLKPFLRKVSRTHSEENIIFDVSKETLSVQNFQQKVQSVATSLVDTVSTTIDQITKTNRPIIRNYSCDDAQEIRILDNEHVPHSPSSDLIFTVPKDPFLSPFYAEDDYLQQFPSIKVLALTLDSTLDDSIMFTKRLRKLNVKCDIDVLDGLPHGFLNFSRLSKEAHDGSKLAMKRIAELLNISLDSDETRVKYFC